MTRARTTNAIPSPRAQSSVGSDPAVGRKGRIGLGQRRQERVRLRARLMERLVRSQDRDHICTVPALPRSRELEEPQRPSGSAQDRTSRRLEIEGTVRAILMGAAAASTAQETGRSVTAKNKEDAKAEGYKRGLAGRKRGGHDRGVDRRQGLRNRSERGLRRGRPKACALAARGREGEPRARGSRKPALPTSCRSPPSKLHGHEHRISGEGMRPKEVPGTLVDLVGARIAVPLTHPDRGRDGEPARSRRSTVAWKTGGGKSRLARPG